MKDSRYLEFRKDLEKISAPLASIPGYDRIKVRQLVTTWEEYQAIRAQIDVTLWFKDKNLLKEIEPKLPDREGYADILLSFSQQDIYCEILSLESFFESMAKKQPKDHRKIESMLKEHPYFTKQDIEHEIRKDRIRRILLKKTEKQLPENHPGILALETGKAWVFHLEVKEIAERFFNSKLGRPNIMLVMLWSLEKGSDIGEAPFWFINHKSQYQNLGQELLAYLKETTK